MRKKTSVMSDNELVQRAKVGRHVVDLARDIS